MPVEFKEIECSSDECQAFEQSVARWPKKSCLWEGTGLYFYLLYNIIWAM